MVKKNFFLVLVALATIFIDQASKSIARIFLAPHATLPVIPDIFHLTLVRNTGAAFGVFKGAALFFIFISIFCISGIIYLTHRREDLFLKLFSLDPTKRVVRLALGLILGGACGNLIDRLRYSHVTDFLDFRIWPVFNLADSAITVGGALLFYKVLKNR